MIVSIIIPALNEEKYLPRLLDSIKKQSFKDYEIIVSDAGSKDSTRQIAKKYGCVVVEGGLPAVGRNRGAKAAKGEILLFLDADVLLAEGFLEKNVNEFQKRKLVSASCLVKPFDGNLFDNVLHSFVNLLLPLVAVISPSAPGYCIFAQKSVMAKMNGFDEHLKMAEDNDFVQRAAKFGKFRYLRSMKIQVSMRRWAEEGRLNMLWKYFLSWLYYKLRIDLNGKFFDLSWGKHK